MNSSLSYSSAPDISRTRVLTALAKCLARNEYNDQLTLLALIDLHNYAAMAVMTIDDQKRSVK